MKIIKILTSTLAACAAMTVLSSVPPLRAADHADAPALAQDQGADIADVFTFLDPDDNNNVIIIGTFHGFIVPGEAGNFSVFDPNIEYHFSIFNTHVNIPPTTIAGFTPAQKKQYLAKVVANRTIDVTFSKREVAANSSDTKFNLAKPGPQSATISMKGFTRLNNRGIFKQTNDSTPQPILATNATLADTANAQKINTIQVDATHTIKFFAGEVDDPFFFDIPGFSRLIDSIHNGNPDLSNLSRGRDTFAGYNILAIALSVPKDLLLNTTSTGGTKLGVQFTTQRKNVQLIGSDGNKGVGVYKQVDSMGNPAVNVALIPFNRKNAYNAASIKAVASGAFVGDIAATITQLGLGTDAAHVQALVDIAVSYGDILILDTAIPNTGLMGGTNAPASYPNGRRLADDTIDIILTVLNNGSAVGDNVNASDVPPQDHFPFLALPQQPRATGVTDDNTRN